MTAKTVHMRPKDHPATLDPQDPRAVAHPPLERSGGRSPCRRMGMASLLALIMGAQTATAQTELPPQLTLAAGTSRVLALPQSVERVSVAHPGVVDVVLTGQRELYVLGRGIGLSNIMLWTRGAPVSVIDVQVEMDVRALRSQLERLLPQENELKVQAAADSVVLWGTVSNVIKAEQAVALAQGHVRALARQAQAGANPGAPSMAAALAGAGPSASGPASAPRASAGTDALNAGRSIGGAAATAAPSQGLGGSPPHVINLLQIRQPQQVMLEVKVVEISRNLLDQFGVSLNLNRSSGSMNYGLVTQALQDVFGRLLINGRSGSLAVDAKAQDGLLKVLAEPNIVALSGQEGSFLAGGKVFIPVARDSAEGRSTITLEEKEYGVGLRFTPQVLEGDVVQLRVAPEVSELTRTGSPFLSSGGVTTVLPSFTTRRAATTVQLRDGQSLAIAGLIKNINTETLTKFPFLGDLPILGALFRSNEFQQDRSEVLFIITPRLVKALPQEAGTTLEVDTEQARQLQRLHPQAGSDPALPAAVDAASAMGARAANPGSAAPDARGPGEPRR
ncbi:MAG: type II and III secretion system protein family protein [Burkholderiaceae bacterium]